MQRLSPLYVAASVVMALAGSAALAQTKATLNPIKPIPSSTSTGAQVQTPRIGGTMPAGRGDAIGGTDGSPAFKASEPTNVDVRNQQNQQATQNTRSSGSTSATQNAGGTTTSGSTSGASSTNGSSSVNGTGAVTGSTGTTGSSSTTTTTDANGNVTTTTTNPLILNGVIGGAVAGSDVVSDNAAVENPSEQNAIVTSSGNSVDANTANVENARAGASMDRVINQASRERKKIGRNGQLLYSIAPHTSVDRSNQMPDDGPSPALKGPLAR
jgi:hypothetical protein